MEIQEVYFNASFAKKPNYYHGSQESNRVIDAVTKMDAIMAEQKAEHLRRRQELHNALVEQPEATIEPQRVTLAFDSQSYDFCDLITMNTTWCNLDTDNVYNIENELEVTFKFADHSITHSSSIDIRHRVTITGALPNVVKAAERFKNLIPINVAFSLENLPKSVSLDSIVAKLHAWKDGDSSKPFSNVEIMLFQPKVHGPIINDFVVEKHGAMKFVGSSGTVTSPCIRVRGRSSSRADIAEAVKAVYELIFEKPAENFNLITCYNFTDRVDEWLQQSPMNTTAQFLADMNDVNIMFPQRPTGDFITNVSWRISGENVVGVVDAAAQIYDLMPTSIKILNVPKDLVHPNFMASVEGFRRAVCLVLDQGHGVGIVVRVGTDVYDLDFVAALGNLHGMVASILKCINEEYCTSEPIPPEEEVNAVGEYYREIFPEMSVDNAFPRAIPCLDFHTDAPWHTVNPSLIRFIPFNQITRVLNEREFDLNSCSTESVVGDDDVFLPSNQLSSGDTHVRLCAQHGHPLITEYEHVQHHIAPRKGLSQCVDETVKFWLNKSTSPHFGANYSFKPPDANAKKEVHLPVETLFTSIQPSLKSKSRRKAERAKQTVLCSKAIHASELESKLVFDSSPMTPSKYNAQNCTTPIEQREVPTTAYIAKFILERVPRGCMTYNFYQYHMMALFHGDMAAKGVVDNYPFSNKTTSLPPGKPMTESEIVQCLGVHIDGDDVV